MKSQLNSFLFKIYSFKFLSASVFLYPVMALMFQKNGVSDIQISILFLMWALFVMIFQPFIGNFGDKYSRKKILIYGQISKLLCFVSFMLIPNFWGYLIGFVFWGIQWAIEASVCDAFVYDELCCMRAKNKYVGVSGKMLAFQNAGLLVSAVGSFFAAKYGYNFVLIMTTFFMFLSTLVISSIKMEQPKCYCTTKTNNSWVQSFSDSLKIIKKIKYCFMGIIIISCIIAIAELDDYIGLLGSEIGIKLEYIGILFSIGRIAEIIGGSFVKYFQKTNIQLISLFIILIGIMFAYLGFSKIMYIWIILFIAYFLYSIVRILLITKIQNSIPSNHRSMILSFADVINQISMMLFYAVITFGAVINGYKTGYLFCGLLIVFLGIFSLIFMKNK